MREYYRLTKPGIVYGNAIAVVAGFLFAAHGRVDVALLAATLVGASAVIASACTVNNVIDRDIDAHMERTKGRALPTGRIPSSHALLFAAALALTGFGALLAFTNFRATLAAFFGAFVYLALYTPAKRLTPYSTFIGALAGAAPPVIGYAAVTGAYDAIALSLFLVLVCWQMVHFFAIALFRMEEYRAAGLPVMPLRIGTARTKALMGVYALLFAFACYAFYVAAAPGAIYAFMLAPVCLGWILLACTGFRGDAGRYGRRMFFYSLASLLLFCLALALA